MRQRPALWALVLDIFALIGTAVSLHLEDAHISAVSECRSMLPLSPVTFVFSWAAVALAAFTAVLGLVRAGLQLRATKQGRPVSGRWIPPLLSTVSILVLLFSVFVLYTTFQESIPAPSPCSG